VFVAGSISSRHPVKPLYGHQEGAVVSHNHHTRVISFLASCSCFSATSWDHGSPPFFSWNTGSGVPLRLRAD
jgi:hypothetical protein